MSQAKQDKKEASVVASSKSASSSEEVKEMTVVASYLPVKSILGIVGAYAADDPILQRLMRGAPSFFPKETHIFSALRAAVYGEAKLMVSLVERNPELLLQKGDIFTPCGDKLHTNVTLLKVILFQQIEWDMLNRIKPIIRAQTPEYRARAHQQYLEMQGGGDDLVKLNTDPRVNFNKVLQCVEHGITFPLLQNDDGLIFFAEDGDEEGQLFYANKKEKTLRFIDETHIPEKFKGAFAAFKVSLKAMEDNSSRRSSNTEHQLIEDAIRLELKRNGIGYCRGGVEYQDTQVGMSQIINAIRRYIRIFDAHVPGTAWDEVDAEWLVYGDALKKSIPLLQWMCGPMPSFPLPSKEELINAPFHRSLEFINYLKGGITECLLPFSHSAGLGVNFSLYKGLPGRRLDVAGGLTLRAGPLVGEDLAAFCRIVEVGKTIADLFIQELEPAPRESLSRARGPGCIVS